MTELTYIKLEIIFFVNLVLQYGRLSGAFA